ncbi:MAG: bifunctional diaminohydroxyphosphoribosylaminopyrimidine deaminase/5-amino-6-(5-phosphoribosylamino)uracil reductase RibD [Desulfovibrio sp.]|nr:bifunctional diaminohydroxyphosphoribosylaminopyrimidine deaminase/5-amino-6-(5-phosphoribosylamino)uracil reductase RibD [Desulfovibrio sp.]
MTGPDFAPFMREAVRLAENGRWTACPNPTVGAVLVREGRIVASGWHHAAGRPHAEVECLRDAVEKGVDPSECTLCVTLEPCNHQGKTPPCSKAVLDAGIRRVVIGLRDPNPVAAGGAETLAAAGVEVLGPVCERECRDLVADFLVWQNKKRPYVILKMAATMDGRIATRTGRSQWISSEGSRREAHRLRAGVGLCGGAVLVGGGTFRADDPLLTPRLDAKDPAEQSPAPLACVLTSRIPSPEDNFHLLRERAEETVFCVPEKDAASPAAKRLEQTGVRILPVPAAPGGGADLAAMLARLKENFGCPYVMCEGGGRLATSLLDAGLVDEFRLHLAPIFLADDKAAPLFTGKAPLEIADALRLRVADARAFGGDVHVTLRPDCAAGKEDV